MSKCKHSHKSYSMKYDAYYCRPCNRWLESKCPKIKAEPCELCDGRPRRPLTS